MDKQHSAPYSRQVLWSFGELPETVDGAAFCVSLVEGWGRGRL